MPAGIDTAANDISNIPSIFSIVKNVDSTVNHITVDENGQRIVIMLPLEDHGIYGTLNDLPALQPILNSMAIIPALVYVLDRIKAQKHDQRYEWEEYAWYRTIRKALLERFTCDIESENFNNENCLELAQKLIDSPFHTALMALNDIGTD